jgi:hypothetical protein
MWFSSLPTVRKSVAEGQDRRPRSHHHRDQVRTRQAVGVRNRDPEEKDVPTGAVFPDQRQEGQPVAEGLLKPIGYEPS